MEQGFLVTTQAPPTAWPWGLRMDCPAPSCRAESQSPPEQRSLEGRGLALDPCVSRQGSLLVIQAGCPSPPLGENVRPVTTHRGPGGSFCVTTLPSASRPAGGCTLPGAEDFFTPSQIRAA